MKMIDPIRERARRHPILSVALISFLWFAVTAWARPLTMPDEGRYVGIAATMLHNGDWLTPHLVGLPFFHKPPLFYWISAAAMGLFGPSEWAARLPSILAAVLSVTGVFAFVRNAGAPRLASISALMLATLPFFYIGAQFANMDMLVAGLMSATVLAGAEAERRIGSTEDARGMLVLAYLLAALAVLAKGLIGFVLPGAILLAHALWRRRGRELLRALCFAPGWLVFLLVSLPWFVLAQWKFSGFFDYFIIEQHVRRFAAGGFNNRQPWWFYLPVLVLLALPNSAWLTRIALRPRLVLNDTDRLMLCWLVVIVAFFSIPQSKLVGYVLPALPPMAYFIARALMAVRMNERSTGRAARALLVVSALTCVVTAGGLAWREREGESAMLRGLSSQVRPGDQVAMLDDLSYQVSFYWPQAGSISVVSDWRPEVAAARDNWKKELFDAGRFAPERSRSVMVADAPACATRTWILSHHVALPEALAPLSRRMARSGDSQVWLCGP